MRTSSRSFIAAVRSARRRSLRRHEAYPARPPPGRRTGNGSSATTRSLRATWHHERMRARTLLGATAVAGALGIGYGAVDRAQLVCPAPVEVPVLAPGASPLRILHISDTHLTPGRHRLLSLIRSLDALEPDLVVNTGDSIAHKDAVQPLLDALGPLLDRPGVFVYGSNDLYSPMPKNPLRYLWRTSQGDHERHRSRPALGRAGRRPGSRRLAERQQPARPDQGRRPGHRGRRGARLARPPGPLRRDRRSRRPDR